MRAIIDVQLNFDSFKNVGILQQGYFAFQIRAFYETESKCKLDLIKQEFMEVHMRIISDNRLRSLPFLQRERLLQRLKTMEIKILL